MNEKTTVYDILTEDIMKELYINQNKTMEEIAAIYNLKKYNVQAAANKYKLKKTKDQKASCMKRSLIKKYGTDKIAKLPEIQDKIKATNLKRYGTEYSLQNKDVIKKRKKTLLIKYGVDNPLKSEQIKEKVAETNLKKYGTKCSLRNPDIQDKVKKTFIKNYGVDNPLKSEDIKNRIKETCTEKYGTNNPLSSIEIQNKIKETCIKKYGVDNPIKNAEIKAKAIETTKERYGTDNVFKLQEFQNLSKIQHVSKYELEIISLLKEFKPDIEIKQSDRTILNGLEIDIYLPEYKFGIEFNGDYWHSTEFKDELYHQQKSLNALKKNVFIYTIYEYEWNNSITKNNIIQQIKDYLNNEYKLKENTDVVLDLAKDDIRLYENAGYSIYEILAPSVTYLKDDRHYSKENIYDISLKIYDNGKIKLHQGS